MSAREGLSWPCRAIFDSVYDAMQEAEGINGPSDIGEYIALMESIKKEAEVRIANARALKAHAEPSPP